MKQIENVIALTVGTTAQTVDVQGLAFLIENNSESATVYIKERRADGKAAAASNGWAVPPGTVLPVALTAMELSVIATGANTDVRLLLLNEI